MAIISQLVIDSTQSISGKCKYVKGGILVDGETFIPMNVIQCVVNDTVFYTKGSVIGNIESVEEKNGKPVYHIEGGIVATIVNEDCTHVIMPRIEDEVEEDEDEDEDELEDEVEDEEEDDESEEDEESEDEDEESEDEDDEEVEEDEDEEYEDEDEDEESEDEDEYEEDEEDEEEEDEDEDEDDDEDFDL